MEVLAMTKKVNKDNTAIMGNANKLTKKSIDFMRQRYVAIFISALLLIASSVSLVINGLQLGLDFTGGLQVEAEFAEPAELEKIRSALVTAGFDNAVVAYFGSEQNIKVTLQRDLEIGIEEKITEVLASTTSSNVTLKQLEYVGPQIGSELRDQGGIGMLFALTIVMLYVAVRFQYKFSLGAVTALIHDVIIVLGVFSLFKLNFDLTVLAAVLAVIGYSLNDTIVVSDRIRENFRKIRKGTPVDIINISLTQTLGRTIITSATTLLVLLALFFTGGELIRGFSTALIIGILVGTYSSIYVAANMLLLLHIDKEDLMLPEKEGAEPLDSPTN